MSYLGQIPKTTRQGTIHPVVGGGTNQNIAYPVNYKQGYLDVYVNGHKIETTAFANDPAIPYYYSETVDTEGNGTEVFVHALNAGDVVEFMNYSVVYIAGSGGGGGTIDQATFNAMFNTTLSYPYGVEFDGGSY